MMFRDLLISELAHYLAAECAASIRAGGRLLHQRPPKTNTTTLQRKRVGILQGASIDSRPHS